MLFSYKIDKRRWKDGLAVKGTCCFPEDLTQTPVPTLWSLQPLVLQLQGLTLSSDLVCTCTCAIQELQAQIVNKIRNEELGSVRRN